MKTILSVAEKPSVAKELAAIISKQNVDGLKRQGVSPYNPVFDIANCSFQNGAAKMIVTSVTGHLMEIEFDAAYKGWNNCQPIELFTAPISKCVKKEGENIEKTLVREARKCNVLLLWLDCDLEGENIAYEVIKVCCEANPRLDVYRARFSALVERDIFRTLKFPDRPNANMNDAVDARQEIDLRIGAAFTRFQTLRLQKKFENIGNSVISFGPCQFPTLGFVVERSAKIKAFRPENYWYINCTHEFDNPDKPGAKLNCSFNWDRVRVYDKFTCIVLYDMCVEGGGVATVTHCNERPTTRQRPIPLNTIDFQMRASRFLRMSSDQAMAVAEALYQRGILSYPRTETNFFQEGIELLNLIGDHRQHPDWGPYAANLVDNHANNENNNNNNNNGNKNRFLWPRAGGKDDQAHPPIHPTKSVALQDLNSEDERKVYDLVSRHFLACCSCDAKGSLSTLSIGVPDAAGEKFNASGLMVTERNWLDVYSQYEQWHANKVPVLRLGDRFQVRSLLMEEGRTCPPQPISESELISTMDKNGIGTDATIATHISTIQAREYAVRNAQNQFEPTKLGLALVEGYNSMGYQLNKPQLRALIEADCQRVAKGEARREDVVRKCLDDMKTCFAVCTREANKLDASMEKYFSILGVGDDQNFRVEAAGISLCGVCNAPMDLRVRGETNTTRYVYCGTCRKSHIVPKGDLSAHAVHCALCRFQVLVVRNPDTNKEHTICPKCFSDPPPPPAGIDGQSEFRCFSCAKEDCALAMRTAGSEVDVSPCYTARCTGSMRMKKNAKGYLLACTVPACKAVWWVPKFARSAVPQAGMHCTKCQQSRGFEVSKLAFRFNLDRAPPGIPPECVLCPCCDPLWREIGQAPLQLPEGLRRGAGGAGGAGQTPRATVGYSKGGANSSMAPEPASTGSDYQAALAGKRRVVAHSSTVAAAAATPRYATGSVAGRDVASSSGTGASVGAGMHPDCSCPAPSKLLTVNKEGANKGRKFFSCAKPRDSGCGYFQWADELPAASAAATGSAGPRYKPSAPLPSSGAAAVQNNYGNHAAGASSARKPPVKYLGPDAGAGSAAASECVCRCGAPAITQVTRKEGPNMGRLFFACRKQRDDATRCDFFQWSDVNG